jgi:hypothetical protein
LTTINNPEIDSTAPNPGSKKVLAGMIVSTVMAILLAAVLVILGLLLFALGGGFGGFTYLSIIFFGPIFLIIPIIASWVFFFRKNTKWTKIMTLGIWGFLILDLIAIGLFVLLTWMISSGP